MAAAQSEIDFTDSSAAASISPHLGATSSSSSLGGATSSLGSSLGGAGNSISPLDGASDSLSQLDSSSSNSPPGGTSTSSSSITTTSSSSTTASSSRTAPDLFGNDDLLENSKVDQSDPLLQMAKDTSREDDIFVPKSQTQPTSQNSNSDDIFSTSNSMSPDIVRSTKPSSGYADLFSSSRTNDVSQANGTNDVPKTKPVTVDDDDDFFASMSKVKPNKPSTILNDDDLFGGSLFSKPKSKVTTKVENDDDIFGVSIEKSSTSKRTESNNNQAIPNAKTKVAQLDEDDLFADSSLHRKRGMYPYNSSIIVMRG